MDKVKLRRQHVNHSLPLPLTSPNYGIDKRPLIHDNHTRIRLARAQEYLPVPYVPEDEPSASGNTID